QPPGVALVGDADLPLPVLTASRRAWKTAGATRLFSFAGAERYSPCRTTTRTRMEQHTTEATATSLPVVSTRLYPRGALDILSRDEVARLKDASSGGLHELLRRCALAVLTSGSASDDPRAAQELYPSFDIQVEQHDRGLRIELVNAPAM